MKSKNIIEVSSLSKKYRINNVYSYGSLRDELVNYFKPSKISREPEYIWALKDINLDIERGSSIGLIGSNGAGKSTLLKVLSRISYPTKGSVRMNGRVSSLLEAGTGFHPELTGKENIFLNGTILGMNKNEIQKQFESIVTFAGVENFLDTPVKHYSSGMYTRLAFSVAAHLDQDILIIDEVLSVGDLSFQNKALEKIGEMEKNGKTVIFVSHSMTAVSRVCNKAIWLEKGKVMDFDKTSKVVGKYIQRAGIKNEKKITFKGTEYVNKTGIDKFKFNSLEIRSHSKKGISFKEPFQVVITGEAAKNLENFSVGFWLKSPSFGHIFNTFSTDANIPTSYKKGLHTFEIKIDPNILLPGPYSLDIASQGSGVSQWIPEAIHFQINEVSDSKLRLNASGSIDYPVTWLKK